nr:immunoglobulin heavy chain junction region [Macaca mulatta]MOW19009.1 immunoglobulin heavy chain junction region [Macaca mulatta]MOW19256.1 immunoglobulin heavy chain junction region [Macaca mulatta]MOW19269.1 immunoglobulin heavy chain junction region [Macaca mulatta]MOW19282.1 immunoglobulin heavy chain junction region [Macaca mulatta]
CGRRHSDTYYYGFGPFDYW